MGGLFSTFNNVDDVHKHFSNLIESASRTTGHQTLIIPYLTHDDNIYDIAVGSDDDITKICTSCKIMKALYRNKPCGHASLCRKCLEQSIRQTSESLSICNCMRKVEEIERILTN